MFNIYIYIKIYYILVYGNGCIYIYIYIIYIYIYVETLSYGKHLDTHFWLIKSSMFPPSTPGPCRPQPWWTPSHRTAPSPPSQFTWSATTQRGAREAREAREARGAGKHGNLNPAQLKENTYGYGTRPNPKRSKPWGPAFIFSLDTAKKWFWTLNWERTKERINMDSLWTVFIPNIQYPPGIGATPQACASCNCPCYWETPELAVGRLVNVGSRRIWTRLGKWHHCPK